MIKALQEQNSGREATPAAKKVAAWRKAVDVHAAEIREQTRTEQAEEQGRRERDYRNPFAFWAGLLALALLLLVGWTTINRLHCDPFFTGKRHSLTCQQSDEP